MTIHCIQIHELSQRVRYWIWWIRLCGSYNINYKLFTNLKYGWLNYNTWQDPNPLLCNIEILTEQVIGWPKKMVFVIMVLLNLNWIVYQLYRAWSNSKNENWALFRNLHVLIYYTCNLIIFCISKQLTVKKWVIIYR